MSRSARITVLELGASAMAWASRRAVGADDWVVVAQQSDEGAADFTRRVQKRAQRLCKDDAQIAAVDVYAGPGSSRARSAARRQVVEDLGIQLATGGRLTLWSASDDARGDAEMTAILAQFGPVLAERQIAMDHQACEAEEPSGVRHALPKRPYDADLEFDEFA